MNTQCRAEQKKGNQIKVERQTSESLSTEHGDMSIGQVHHRTDFHLDESLALCVLTMKIF